MVDVTLVEGCLRFEFINVEFAVKYDDWQHYRKTFMKACGGAKAIDFVVVKGTEIWLIEVKDYRQHRRNKQIDLWEEIALKVRDTLAGLVSARFIGDVDGEKNMAKAALKKRKLRVALHLEQARKHSKLFPILFNPANVKLKLKQIVRFADAHPCVFDRDNFPPSLGTVTNI